MNIGVIFQIGSFILAAGISLGMYKIILLNMQKSNDELKTEIKEIKTDFIKLNNKTLEYQLNQKDEQHKIIVMITELQQQLKAINNAK